MSARPQPQRLGRGLAALLGDFASQPSYGTGNEMGQVALDLLDPNPYQPRGAVDPASLEELAGSIRAQGVLQPLLVRPHPTETGRYQIIAGERRWRAAAMAGLHEVPVMRREIADAEIAAAALVENLQRQDLNPIEEAEGYQRLADEFGHTQEAIGYAVGKSRAHISNMLRLQKLPDRVRERVRRGDLSFGHARALLASRDPEALMQEVLTKDLSVRDTEALAAREATAPRARVRPQKHADIVEWEHALAQSLGVRVAISAQREGKGHMTLHFSNAQQLEEIVQKLMES